MRKNAKGLLCLLLLAGLLGGAAACTPAPQATLTPPVVKAEGVYRVFGGAESVVFKPVFVVSNPNDFDVTLQTLEYSLAADSVLLRTASLTDRLYIPAKGEVKVADTAVVAWASTVTTYLSSRPGLPMAQANTEVLPFWKLLGGILPDAKLQPDWDKAPAGAATFTVKGSVSASSSKAGGGTWAFKFEQKGR